MNMQTHLNVNRFIPTLTTLLILLTTLGSLGCAKHVVAPVPGAINSFDQYAYRIIYDGQAALNAFRSDVTSGKVPENPTIRSAFNTAADDFNLAESTYKLWRAAGGNGSTAALSAAIGKFQSDISNIATTTTTTGK